MKTIKPESIENYYDSIEVIVDEESAKTPLWKRVSAGVVAAYAALVFGAGSMTACGDNGGNGNLDSGTDTYKPKPDQDVSPSNPLAPISSSSVTPADGKKVGPSDSPLTVGFKIPGQNPNYTGSTPTGIAGKVTASGDNATPSDATDDWTTTIADTKSASIDELVGGQLDLTTANNGSELKDGEKVKFGFEATAKGDDGKDYTQTATSTVTYEGTTNKLQVVGCYVKSSSVGSSLGIACTGKDPAGKSLKSFWKLTTDLQGASMVDIANNTSNITKTGLTQSDVGIHNFSVTCGNGTDTSAPYAFSVPVDEHGSQLTLKCSDGTNNTLLLPETSVDAVASKCGSGYNAALKPANKSSPVYKLDVTSTCVEGAINGLNAAEKQSHTHYNNGKTVSDFYKACSITFAQVSYTSLK